MHYFICSFSVLEVHVGLALHDTLKHRINLMCVWEFGCLYVCYLSILHYNQPSLVEDRNRFCTTMSNSSTAVILHQHSEWTLFSVTHVLLIRSSRKRQMWERIERWNESICFDTTTAQSILELFLYLSVSYLDQDILAETREGIFEAIKTDEMPLSNSAAHTIAHLLCAAPFPVFTDAVNQRAC